jgi:hypothetical protein
MIVDVFVFILVISLGIVFPYLFGKQLSNKDRSALNKLWAFHLLISIYFCFFVFGDAVGYWKVSKGLTFDQFVSYLYEAKGTYFMYSFNYFPSGVLDLSYFAGTMLYSFIGFMGIVFFYILAIRTVPYNVKFKGYKLFPLVFFMPNLHFWSSGIGKDTLLFFCIGIFVYSILNIVKRLPLLVLSLLLSFLLRPHITLFLLVSYALAYVFGSKVSGFKRIALVILLVGGCISILPTVMEFTKVEEASVESFNQFSERKAAALSREQTGSAIDVSSYPLPLKIFTFLYRPFFFDVNGVPALIASFENFALLVLSIHAFRYKPIDTFKAAPVVIKGLLFFLAMGTLIFSQSLGNVGIMIRMRNMFLPGMLIYFLWALSSQRQFQIKLRNHKRKLRTQISEL